MNDSVENAVIGALKEMGVWAASPMLYRTFALSEGHVVAQKFLYQGGYAVWVAGSGIITFYDEDGRQLRSLQGRIAA